MSELTPERRHAEIERQTGLLADLIENLDPETPVPTCPGWTMSWLAEHVGRTQRWAATIVGRRLTEPIRPKEADGVPGPEGMAGKARWLREGAGILSRAMEETDPATPVWSWATDHTAGFWARRMVHETTVHRADACAALGLPFMLAGDVAADGISEWLGFVSEPALAATWPGFAELRGSGETLHLHATDEGLGDLGEWLIRRLPAGVTWEHGHGKGDVAVRGAAADLLQLAHRRIAPTDPRIEVFGDEALLEHWLAHTAF